MGRCNKEGDEGGKSGNVSSKIKSDECNGGALKVEAQENAKLSTRNPAKFGRTQLNFDSFMPGTAEEF